MLEEIPFQSFFGGGFECSTHRIRSGRRLDLLAATKHDRYAEADYRCLQQQGVRFARDGIRWHLIETRAGKYDFTSILPMLRAARNTGVQVIWDLCHYGYPDDIDIYKPEFVKRYVAFVRALALLLLNEMDDVPFVVPINEMSMWSWAGGDVGQWKPFSHGRGFELKAQLAHAAIEGIEAFRHVIPETRIVLTEPAINVIGDPAHPEQHAAAAEFHERQFQACDMLSGRLWPMLGGDEKYLDIIGINYYPWNQWIYRSYETGGETISMSHPQYKPLRTILREIYDRYRRPLFIAETSAEGDQRIAWLRYLGAESRAAIDAGIPVYGLCWYPILDYPGWEDERKCCTGLWGFCDDTHHRDLYQPLGDELNHQTRLMEHTLHRHGIIYRQPEFSHNGHRRATAPIQRTPEPVR